MKSIIRRSWLVLALILLAACVPPAGPSSSAKSQKLTVLAAASLTEAFQDLAERFETRHPGVDVVFNFAGSQQLAQQIGQGVPADIFASANNRQMQAAIESGRVISGTQQTFTGNRLVVITPADNPAGLATLQDLVKPGIKLLLAAPEVPVGGYSIEFLEKAGGSPDFPAGFQEAVQANVVSYEENVKAVLSKVSLGEADAGIVYTSDAPPSLEEVARIAIPDSLNVPASYPIAMIEDSANRELAQQFLAFVLSPEGQSILANYGFVSPGG